MKVVLVHVDGKMPNPALMKLSAFHKKHNDSVMLVKMKDYLHPPLELFTADSMYASCIFDWSDKKVKLLTDFANWKKSKNPNFGFQIGGSGYNVSLTLPDEIEHTMPDYSLYGIDYSMGFTSRGCIRNCPWCIVPKKEGVIRDHASISEFHDPKHSKLILLDNNFLASPKWKDNLFHIIEHKLQVNFNQGLDIRLINDYNANLLAHCQFRNWTFKSELLHFAFDEPKIEDAVRKGVEILKTHGISPRKLMFYMLVGFNTTFEEDIYRFNVLRELGLNPFVMIYNNRKDKPLLRHFARWVNKTVYKKCSFKNYKHGNSEKVITELQ